MPTKKKVAKKTSPKQETLVNFILDKSGSMGSIKESTINGFNKYLATLKNDGNKYSFSLVLFETAILDYYINEPIDNVKELAIDTYMPDGWTALYDSVCQTIKKVEKTVKKNQKVLTVILTDGQENSSQEFSQKDMRDMITKLEKTGKWTFVFLGANQDSFATGGQAGVAQMNTTNFQATNDGIMRAFAVTATNTSNFSAQSAGATNMFYCAADQANLSGTASPLDSKIDPKISAHFSSLGKKGYEAKKRKILGDK